MAEVAANLNIRATGADQASAALNSVTQGMESIGRQHNDLVDKFGHRFSHMGLQLFAGEALQAAGAGMETRQVIGTLNLAMTSLGGAFGGAAPMIILVGTAIASVIGLMEKLESKHKSEAEAMNKVNTETDKQLEANIDSIESIQKYGDAVGTLPPELTKWMEAEQELRKAQVDRQITGDQAELQATQLALMSAEKRIKSIDEEIQQQEKLTASLKSSGVDSNIVSAQIAQLKKLMNEYDKQSISVEEYDVKIKKLNASIALLGSYGSDNIKKITQAEVEANKEAQKLADETLKKFIEDSKREGEEDTARWQNWAKLREEQTKMAMDEENKVFEHGGAIHAKEVESHKISRSAIEKEEQVHSSKMITLNELMYKEETRLSNQFFQAQGDAFAKMVVEGKSFTDAMKSAFKNMAESFISFIEQMIVKWLAFQALTGGAGGGFAAATHFFGGAEGLSMTVDKPTMFLAGEAGQSEVVNITPFSKLGQGQGGDATGGSGTTINIGTIQTNVQGATNADDIADQVGMKIVERIRGRGDIGFARAS